VLTASPVGAASCTGEFRRSWRVVLATTVTMFAAWLPANTFGLFIEPLAGELHWSNSAIGGWVTALFLGTTLIAPGAGYVADRFGARWIVIGSLPLYALSIASLGLLHGSIRVLYVSGLAAGCAGASLVGTGPTMRAVVSWFEVSRGLALSCVAAGSSSATLFGPKLMQPVVDCYGWRAGFFLLGGICFIPLPFVLAWMRERPLAEEQSQQSAREVERPLRRPLFWCFAVVSAFAYCGIYGVIIFLAPFMSSLGIDRASAATYVGLFGVSSVAAKLISGYLNDRLHAPAVGAVMLLTQSLALFTLAKYPTAAPVLLCMLVGFSFGSQSTTQFYALSRYFSLRSFGVLVGILTLIGGVGSSLGPYQFGMLRDLSGDFSLSLASSATMALVAAAFTAVIARVPYPRRPLVMVKEGVTESKPRSAS
jgi:predicted MFS family arabinose efflux permease